MSSPRISVIIVNYNGKELLQKCLESLFKIDYNNFEVILVDNNSTDGSMEFVIKNHPNVIVVKLDSNKGFAEPNNIGAKIAKGEYLLFLNNDTITTTNFISEMIKVLEKDEKIAICQSLLRRRSQSQQYTSRARIGTLVSQEGSPRHGSGRGPGGRVGGLTRFDHRWRRVLDPRGIPGADSSSCRCDHQSVRGAQP